MPTRRSGSLNRLLFLGNTPTNFFNAFTPGAAVGGLNTSVRRAQAQRATLRPGNMYDPNSRKPGCGSCQ